MGRGGSVKVTSAQAATDNRPRRTAVAVGDVGGRLAGGIWNFKGHRDGQVSDVTVVTCYLRVVDSMAVLCHGRLFLIFQAENDRG